MELNTQRPSAVLCVLVVIGALVGVWLGGRRSMEVDGGTTAASKRGAEYLAPGSVSPGAAQLTQAGASQAIGTLMLKPVQWKAPTPPPAGAIVSKARESILASALLPPGSLAPLGRLHVGDHVRFALGSGEVEGVIGLVTQDDGFISVGGRLIEAGRGDFAFNQEHKTGGITGHILDRKEKFGYQIENSPGGTVIQKKPIGSVVCAMPRYRGPATAAKTTRSSGPQALTVPMHESRPGAAGVMFLDFDGATVIDPAWNGGATIEAAPATIAGSPITAAQITDVWKKVAEDFRPFDLNVTTDLAVYNAAAAGHRARCIITPTDGWYGGFAGGVAYLKSYRGPAEGFSSSVPCWCWNDNDTSIMAMTISHEFGHMMDLSHDGTSFDEYYAGHDFGIIGWGPLMGAPFGKALTQWSKGEYPGANNTEDDFSIISATVAEPAVGHSYITDDAGGTAAAAKALAFTSPINQAGIVTSSTDVDFFSFKTAGGALSVTVQPEVGAANLDAQLELYTGTGVLLQTSAQTTTSLGSLVSASLPTAGTYYLAVRGRGRPSDTTVTGYSSYGSAGAYTLTGTYVPLPEAPLIVQQPVGLTANQSSKVALTAKVLSNSTLVYQWFKIVGGLDQKLTGKTSSTLAFNSLQPRDAGDYKLVSTNKVGSTTSDVVSIDVRYKPVFNVQPGPSKQTVGVSTNVSFSAAAEGTAPITFQWKKNGTLLPGETGATLNLGAVDWDDGATYTVFATNALGTTTSLAAVLTVSSAPVFRVQPIPLVKPIPLGGSASMSVQVVGTPTMRYQWFKDTLPIPGATKSSYSWSATKLLAEGIYYVRATNGVGFTDSVPFTVDVQDKPVIDTNPAPSTTLVADQALALSFTAHGTDTLLYQWQLNGKNVLDSAVPPVVTGANTPTLQIPAVSWLHRGTWRCVVSNAVGSATTKNAVVNVSSYPVILTQPANTKIAKNGTGTLRVVAGGDPTLKYQWFKDSVLIPKATASSLVLTKASVALTNGSYTVQVSNTRPLPLSGPVISAAAIVTVEDAPVVAAPSPLTQVVGVGDSVTFTGNVTQGSPTLRFQWQKNNVDIAGQTGRDLTLTNVQTTTSGSYRLVVTNDVGKGYSPAAKLSVLVRPVVTLDPLAQTVYAWDNVTFTTKATGSPTLTYQWYFDGNPIDGNSSARTATLKLPAVQAAAAGLYSVAVSNGAGSATSSTAQLTVVDVPAPTMTDVRPTNVVVGSKIDIFGTNLQWTTKVTVNGKNASFVKVRANELIVTVPSGITPFGDLTVETRGGIITWGAPITHDKTGAENDDFLNAKLLLGGTSSVTCNNTTATYGAGDSYSYLGAYKTVWFRWRASFSGSAYFSTSGTAFHYYVTLHSGSPTAASPYELKYLDYYENHLGQGGGTDDSFYIRLNVTYGTEYYVVLDSAHSGGTYYPFEQGTVYLKVGKTLYMPQAVASSSLQAKDGAIANAPLDGQQDWQADGGKAQVQSNAEDATRLEGTIGGELTLGSNAAAASLPAAGDSSAQHPIVHASAGMTIQSSPDVGEEFSWAMYDEKGSSVVALIFRNADRSVVARINDQTLDTTQTFAPDVAYSVDMEVNREARTWSIALNGVTIAQGENLVIPSGGISHFAAGWRPAPGLTTGGSMKFDKVMITSEDPPEVAAPSVP